MSYRTTCLWTLPQLETAMLKKKIISQQHWLRSELPLFGIQKPLRKHQNAKYPRLPRKVCVNEARGWKSILNCVEILHCSPKEICLNVLFSMRACFTIGIKGSFHFLQTVHKSPSRKFSFSFFTKTLKGLQELAYPKALRMLAVRAVTPVP